MFIRRTTTGAASDGSRHPTHRLVETFRVGGKVRQRTLLNLGRHFSVPREDWPTLCRRIEELLVGQVSLAPVEPDTEASARLICRQLLARKGREAETPGPDWQTVDVNWATDFEPRSVGVEHAALAAVERFGLPTLLDRLGFNRRMKACAIASIVARMAVPGSERAALAWLRRRSGPGEPLGFDMAGLGDMALYRASDLLMDHRDAIEDHLFERARSLFDFAPTVALHDLTNTYLTGRPAMPKAKRGHSKENRTDCPLLTLALVLDGSGFVRRSRVYPGNVAERDTMFEMLKSLGAEPGSLVVMDAGIADADNLAELRQARYRYLVVSRERTRRFDADEAEAVRTASRQQVHIYKTVTDVDEDGNVVREARLHCFSEARAEKERGIMKRFMDRFENGLREIDEGLSRPRTRKRRDLVQRRIGRLQKASSRAARHYEVTIKAEGERAVAVTWELKPVDGSMLTHPGVYCLRSNELDMTAEEMWRTYVTLTDLETWFRTLKTGTRINRRLDSADDLRKCLAFDAVTAVHVADLTVLARERPETPATEAFPDEDVDLLHTLLESQGHRNVVRMPDGKPPDIRAVVIDLGRLVGSHPSPRQPLPGTKKVWQGLERLHWAIQVRDAIGERKRE